MTTELARPRVRIAHSPDADDVFMLHGLATGAVDPRGLDVELVAGDIGTLNRRAMGGELEVSAISFAAYPWCCEHYDLLPVGSSFGLGYGPRVVARRPLARDALRGAIVAVPGFQTTAALLLRLWAPGAAVAVVPFEEVVEVVASGEVAAGVVIHEAQLTHGRRGLELVQDLGAWWAEETGGSPVPLGANVIRRDLGAVVAGRVKTVLRESIEHARANRRAAVDRALDPGRGLDAAEGDRYVAMYVNDLTLDAGARGRAAVAELLDRGARSGLMPASTPRWA
jgi:1,4-dihydroxy-6-naphthoate synthase